MRDEFRKHGEVLGIYFGMVGLHMIFGLVSDEYPSIDQN
jgi:hypothetical protein